MRQKIHPASPLAAARISEELNYASHWKCASCDHHLPVHSSTQLVTCNLRAYSFACDFFSFLTKDFSLLQITMRSNFIRTCHLCTPHSNPHVYCERGRTLFFCLRRLTLISLARQLLILSIKFAEAGMKVMRSLRRTRGLLMDCFRLFSCMKNRN